MLKTNRRLVDELPTFPCVSDLSIFYFLVKLELEFRGRKLHRPKLVLAYPTDQAKVVGCGLPISLRASISILPYLNSLHEP